MADTSALIRGIETWAAVVQDKAASSMVRRVSEATPKITGGLERSRTRNDSSTQTSFTSTIRQPAGPGEPDLLPNWIDDGTQFEIRARQAPLLVFPRVAGLGGASVPRGFVFAKRVVWRPKPGGVRFWSKTMNAESWQRSLQAAAATTRLRT
jgi:hypothetical protein